MKVAIVEQDKFGGTCVNNGCTPTKAMVASAYVAHIARRASEYGIVLAGTPSVNMERVKARKDGIVRESRERVENWMQKNATIYRGRARFSGAQAVE
jgi:pyruvate/2-oxoglutarate dehydrogenase complex dihydrolipoamide dehydrogenase (E3) component